MTWQIPTPGAKYGGSLLGGVPQASPLTDHVAAPVADNGGPWYSPHEPLFWFGVFAAAAVGLMSASTHVRVGPVGAGVELGK